MQVFPFEDIQATVAETCEEHPLRLVSLSGYLACGHIGKHIPYSVVRFVIVAQYQLGNDLHL